MAGESGIFFYIAIVFTIMLVGINLSVYAFAPMLIGTNDIIALNEQLDAGGSIQDFNAIALRHSDVNVVEQNWIGGLLKTIIPPEIDALSNELGKFAFGYQPTLLFIFKTIDNKHSCTGLTNCQDAAESFAYIIVSILFVLQVIAGIYILLIILGIPFGGGPP